MNHVTICFTCYKHKPLHLVANRAAVTGPWYGSPYIISTIIYLRSPKRIILVIALSQSNVTVIKRKIVEVT